MAKMTQTTPYSARPERERAEEARCFREVLTGASVREMIYEAFGGIGMTAALMQELFPGAYVVSAELDAECVRQYRLGVDTSRASIHHGDTLGILSRVFERPDQFCMDAASLDYNRCTLLDLQNPKSFQANLIRRVADLGPTWIQYTDSSIGKLHLNWRSYGLACYDDRPSAWVAYNLNLNRWFKTNIGYKIVAQARHSAASYYRLERV
ncbi:hypothetical protein Pam3_39 [Pseudanabaena phage Pam3]|nr:hypothetical protein Pam3_39 [Pseudanabaena phage Pam3]